MKVHVVLGFILASLPSVGLADDYCAWGRWSLTGANIRADQVGAAYLPEWDVALQKIAWCVERDSARTACLIVQGQYDATPIVDEVARAFASAELAQQARARGRSTAVIRRLIDFGVAGDRLREAAPGTSPTFRGVSLALDPTCRGHLTDEERAALEQARLEAEAARLALEAERKRLAVEREEAERARYSTPDSLVFFGQVGIQGALGLATDDGSTSWPLALRGAVGLTRDWFTLFGGGAIGIANRSTQANARELFASAGARPLPWLTLGPTGGVRFGSSGFFTNWLERSWYLGVFANEELRLGEHGSLVFEQAIHPLGQEQYRGTVIDGEDVWLVSHSRRLSRLELGVAYRYSF